MKTLKLWLCAALFAVTVPVPSAQANVAVSIDFFFDTLSPHGDWVYANDYGYVWQPVLARQSGWAPYVDGYWAYTDGGWTWISNEDFGWATYHYGRWIRMQGGWFWVPGYEWAPAWVSWRQTNDHVGWAPLPPEARWSVSIGFNQWTDSYYDIGPSYYNFVPFHLFARRSSLRSCIVDRSYNVNYIHQSVNITNISYQQNVVNNIFVGGPDPDRFGSGDTGIRRLGLRRDDDSFRRDWIDNRGERPEGFRSLSRIERGDLVFAAPLVRRDTSPGIPSRVRESLERPEIDRGWRGVGDSKAAESLRERHRDELAKFSRSKLPEKTPELITSKVPPPAVGRVLRPEERRGSGNVADPRRSSEEVRKAEPLTRNPNDMPRPEFGKSTNEEDRRRVGPPTLPGSSTETRRPTSPTVDAPPKAIPYTPGSRPSLPGRTPEVRGPKMPTSPFSPPKARPMPESRPTVPTSRSFPERGREIRPSIPEPRSMPPQIQRTTPQVRPQITPPSRPAPQVKPAAPQIRPPSMPQRSVPQVRPTIPQSRPQPQVRPSVPQSRPMPQARPSIPAPRPMPQVRPAAPPQVRPSPAPSSRSAPSAPKPGDRRRER